MDGTAIGIDLGGTYIKGVATDPEGNILGWEKLSTQRNKGVEHVLSRLDTLIGSLSEKGRPLKAVGIGIPGMLDVQRERVILAPNLDWRDLDLGAGLRQRFGVPVFLENDANVAALGEAWLGAARNSSCFLLVTIGTGIGSGLILHRKIWPGSHGLAGELGHMTIEPGGPLCSCGQKGCLETLVSGPAILSRALEASIVGEEAEVKDVLELVRKGNREAARVVDQAMDYLAIGLKNTIVLLDLDLILIGGGIGEAGELFIDRLQETTASLLPVPRDFKIVQASLGNKAGALGAARLAFKNLS